MFGTLFFPAVFVKTPSSPSVTSLCSASYVRWQRGTTRIRPPLLQSAAIRRYLLSAGPTTANRQPRHVAGEWDRQKLTKLTLVGPS